MAFTLKIIGPDAETLGLEYVNFAHSAAFYKKHILYIGKCKTVDGTYPFILFHSDDLGKTWTKVLQIMSNSNTFLFLQLNKNKATMVMDNCLYTNLNYGVNTENPNDSWKKKLFEPWQPGRTYFKDEACSYNGKNYILIVTSSAAPPLVVKKEWLEFIINYKKQDTYYQENDGNYGDKIILSGYIDYNSLPYKYGLYQAITYDFGDTWTVTFDCLYIGDGIPTNVYFDYYQNKIIKILNYKQDLIYETYLSLDNGITWQQCNNPLLHTYDIKICENFIAVIGTLVGSPYATHYIYFSTDNGMTFPTYISEFDQTIGIDKKDLINEESYVVKGDVIYVYNYLTKKYKRIIHADIFYTPSHYSTEKSGRNAIFMGDDLHLLEYKNSNAIWFQE